MAEDRGVIRRIVWLDIFPGIMLFRCFRLAVGLPVLFLATVGTLLMPVGPWLTRAAIPRASQVEAPGMPTTVLPAPLESSSDSRWRTIFHEYLPLPLPVPRSSVPNAYFSLVRPFAHLFDRNATLTGMLGHFGVGLWYLLVWAFVGGAITRMAIVQLGCGERVSLRHAVRHTLVHYGWYVSSPLFPLLGVVLSAAAIALIGAIMQLNFGVLVAGLLWPLVLVGGLIMAVLLIGLLFGWLLMWPTLSAEESSDSFQAFSNSFSFTYQRPLQYLAYAVLAALIGGLGGIFVELFAEAIIGLSYWALSFGLGSDRLNRIVSGELDSSSLVWFGAGLMHLGNWFVQVVAHAYYFSFLFCAASAIYLLLRREVDQTDFDEVSLPEQVEPFSLPPLKPGPHGVPEVEEAPPLPTGDRPSE